MIKAKTISEEKIKRLNRNALLFFLFMILVVPFIVNNQTALLAYIFIAGLAYLIGPFFMKNDGKIETGYLELEEDEVRVLDLSKNITTTLPIDNSSDLELLKPRNTFFHVLLLGRKHPLLTVHSNGTAHTFHLLLDSKMVEKQLEERLSLSL